MAELNLFYVPHREIDRVAWDACIDNAPLSLTYAASWYLDRICDQGWDAMVLGDYQAVMPLPTRRKLGLPYLYQPFFCQQLGVFGQQVQRTSDFIQAIPAKFRLGDLQLHTATPDTIGTPGTTYWLDLRPDDETLFAGFNKDAVKNLRKLHAVYGNITLQPDYDFGRHMVNYRRAYGAMNPQITWADYARFSQALETAAKHGKVYAYTAITEAGEPLASGVFLQSRAHLHYVMGAPSAGKGGEGVHALIDRVIALHAGQPLTLDFEGSEIAGVAYFYRKFGAEPVFYRRYRLRRFPFTFF
jgi:hypothetical protein